MRSKRCLIFFFFPFFFFEYFPVFGFALFGWVGIWVLLCAVCTDNFGLVIAVCVWGGGIHVNSFLFYFYACTSLCYDYYLLQ